MASSPAIWTATRITLSATPGNVTQVNVPAYAETCLIQPIATAAKLVVTSALADNDPIAAVDYLTLAANAIVPFPCGGLAKFLLASASISPVIEVIFLPRVS